MSFGNWQQELNALETDIEEQPFSTVEYRNRLEGVRAAIRDRRLDALLVTTPENIFYLTGFDTTGFYSYQCLVVPETGEPAFIVRQLEGPNVEHRAWNSRRKEYGETYGEKGSVETTTGIAATVDLLAEMNLSDCLLGFEQDSWFITHHQLTLLDDAVPGELVGCSGIVEAERVVKSEAELEYIRQAADIVETGIKAGIDAVREDVVENEIAAETYSALINAGAMHGTRVYVTSGTRSGLPHARWKGRTVQQTEPVNFEIGAAVDRYYASLWRTVHIGDELPPLVERARDHLLEGLDAAIQTIKPGVSAAQVHEECQSVLRDAGLDKLSPHRTGYSLGIGYPPGWGEGHILSLGPGDETELEPDMVFHIPVTVILPDYGTVGCSATVRVADDGVEILADLDRNVHLR